MATSGEQVLRTLWDVDEATDAEASQEGQQELHERRTAQFVANAQGVERAVEVVVQDDAHEQQQAAGRDAHEVERVGDVDRHRDEDKAAVTAGGRRDRCVTMPRSAACSADR